MDTKCSNTLIAIKVQKHQTKIHQLPSLKPNKKFFMLFSMDSIY